MTLEIPDEHIQGTPDWAVFPYIISNMPTLLAPKDRHQASRAQPLSSPARDAAFPTMCVPGNSPSQHVVHSASPDVRPFLTSGGAIFINGLMAFRKQGSSK